MLKHELKQQVKKLARARNEEQLTLLEPELDENPLPAHAHSRNLFGELAQEVACSALKLKPIPIDGSCDVCFDGERNNQFYEIKSLAWPGKAVIYKWRLHKEATYNPTYAFVIRYNQTRPKNRKQLVELFTLSNIHIYLVPHFLVEFLAKSEPLVKPKHEKGVGYTRPGCLEGYYNIPAEKIVGTERQSTRVDYLFRGNRCQAILHRP